MLHLYLVFFSICHLVAEPGIEQMRFILLSFIKLSSDIWGLNGPMLIDHYENCVWTPAGPTLFPLSGLIFSARNRQKIVCMSCGDWCVKKVDVSATEVHVWPEIEPFFCVLGLFCSHKSCYFQLPCSPQLFSSSSPNHWHHWRQLLPLLPSNEKPYLVFGSTATTTVRRD